jgi:hypothetical protein
MHIKTALTIGEISVGVVDNTALLKKKKGGR